MFALILIIQIGGSISMTAVEFIATRPICEAMGKQFVQSAGANNSRYICLHHGSER